MHRNVARKKLKMHRQELEGVEGAAREKPHQVRRGKRRQMFELQIKRAQQEERGEKGKAGRGRKSEDRRRQGRGSASRRRAERGS